jgi:hypothetical protein
MQDITLHNDRRSDMKAVFAFLASMAGRVVRALAGIVLIVIGLALVKGTGGWILALIGLVPLAAGVFDFCVFAPLAKLPFTGPALRKALGK